jgi:NADPH:quinone reductase-like Zn-dependent oxidoreductase
VRAALCREYGPPDVVEVVDVPDPELGAGQVRVQVRCAAVNFPDVLLIANEYQVKVPTPFIPGSEWCGEVIEAAPDVTAVRPGDLVMGTGIVGAFAEQVVTSATGVVPVPKGLDPVTAAAFGVGHRTAYHVLRSVARVQPGDEVVVLGAGGGVGTATVQLAHHFGARVTAVADSAAKLEVARERGAEVLVDTTAGDLRQSLKAALPDGADVVVDPVGGDLSEPALRSMRYGGRFVTVGYASGTIPRIPLNLVLLKGVQLLGFQFPSFAMHQPDEHQRNEQELLELLVAGKVAPHVGTVLPLDGVVDALREVGEGRAVGKVVLTLD